MTSSTHDRPEILRWLRQLDELDTAARALAADSKKLAALTAEIEVMRQRLPTAILTHYDQRRARNRPALAPVRRGVCGACHISMSRGKLADLHRTSGILNVCENCGAFIYLDDSQPAE